MGFITVNAATSQVHDCRRSRYELIFPNRIFLLHVHGCTVSYSGRYCDQNMKRLKKGAFSDSRSVFFFSFYLDMLKWPVLGDYFISETGLGATTFVPLGSLGHLSKSALHRTMLPLYPCPALCDCRVGCQEEQLQAVVLRQNMTGRPGVAFGGPKPTMYFTTFLAGLCW